jgi:hypothetical protein
VADKANRVCAWCGTSDGLGGAGDRATTHGLCKRCLSERMGEDSAEDGDARPTNGERPEDPDLSAQARPAGVASLFGGSRDAADRPARV